MLLSEGLAWRSDGLLLRLWLCHTLLAQDAGVPSVLDLRRNTRGLRQATKLVQLRLRETLTAEDVSLEPPGQVLSSLVFHVSACGHGEDVIELLERSLLSVQVVSILSTAQSYVPFNSRLWHPQETNRSLVDARYKFGVRLTS